MMEIPIEVDPAIVKRIGELCFSDMSDVPVKPLRRDKICSVCGSVVTLDDSSFQWLPKWDAKRGHGCKAYKTFEYCVYD